MDRLFALVAVLLGTVALVVGVRSTSASGHPDAPAPAFGIPYAAGAAVPGGPVLPGAPAPAPKPAPGTDALDWAVLTAYDYKPGLLDLPDAVKSLDGKRVTMRGFLLPLYEFDDIHEFVLVANHMSCCFGMPAGISGQVQVKMPADAKGLPNTSEPLRVEGTFRVVETKEQGYILSIFRIDDATVRIEGY